MGARALRLAAFDLGAESGRCILAAFDGRQLTVQEVHRFPNRPVQVLNSLYWDVLRLFDEIIISLRLCGREGYLEAVGVDGWGVDFALLDRHGNLLENPYHYRDRRTEGMMEVAFRKVGKERIFERTGIQFMPINSLYQLLAMAVQGSTALEQARVLLGIPDLFHYWLCGVSAYEFTHATTTQCYDPRVGDWARDLLEKLGIPSRIMPPVTPPGTVRGKLLAHIQKETGLGPLPVIAPATHDTASAVAAVPADGEDFAYISSGTWSLVGIETSTPLINQQVLVHNLTNEGGVFGTFRLLRNVMGMWLIQQCRRLWVQKGDTLSYEDLMRMASEAPGVSAIINPDDEAFLWPTDMPNQIIAFCKRTGQEPPQTMGEIIRCILESLALRYRWVLERLEEVSGQKIRVVHLVGGGARNALHCQLTADATKRPVIAGPAEATAMGNALMQLVALGHLASLRDLRSVVRDSVELAVYEPHTNHAWDEAYARFRQLIGA